jgi:UDP-N-acetylglucosamine--dolichyl-phosphate N-acetylglucosaminephosphotransferase
MAPTLAPRRLPKVLLLGLLPVAAWFILRPLLDPVPSLPALHASLGLAILAFVSAMYLVPALGPTFVDARLFGRDLLKTDSTPVYVHICFIRFWKR